MLGIAWPKPAMVDQLCIYIYTCYPDSVYGPAFNRARDMVHWLFVNYDQCRLLLLRKRPTLLKLCCAGVVLLGLILSLIPVIAGMDKEGESGKQAWLQQPIVGRILWPLCFMFGFVSLVTPFNLLICHRQSSKTNHLSLTKAVFFGVATSKQLKGVTDVYINSYSNYVHS